MKSVVAQLNAIARTVRGAVGRDYMMTQTKMGKKVIDLRIFGADGADLRRVRNPKIMWTGDTPAWKGKDKRGFVYQWTDAKGRMRVGAANNVKNIVQLRARYLSKHP